MKRSIVALCALGVGLVPPGAALAHGPIFSFSPHTEYKHSYEYSLGYDRDALSGANLDNYFAEFKYGITSDWTIGAALPFRTGTPVGAGDAVLKTKYRFWRRAALGELSSLTVLGSLKLDTARDRVGTGSTDSTVALAYGYESIKWYRWASVGYRYNGVGHDGLRRGGTRFFNVAGGWRVNRPDYDKPDLVLLTEINAEIAGRARRNGQAVADSGGTEVFVSPGMILTYKQLAFRPGVQIPIYHDLNSHQPKTDYRVQLEVEMHF
ncbi:MAG: hypothetical protein WCE70_07825 [Rhodanobacteraceae bacterium]